MKLSPRTFRIEWDLHAWAGVVASLFLFVIFFCGVFALFREELEVWEDPARHVARSHAEPVSFERALAIVRREADVPRGSRVGFSAHEGTALLTAHVTPPGAEEGRTLWVDASRGAVVSERSRLANELYLMHFFYRVPYGLETSGVLAVALLVALVSGLLIHLKDLRRQWWQFRPALRLRFSASDAHKVLGVFGLPFCAVLAWSGAVLCLSGLIGSGLAATNFGGDREQMTALHGRVQPARPVMHTDADMLSIDDLVARARAALPGASGEPRYIDVQHYGDRAAWARVYFKNDPLVQARYAYLDAVTGETLGTSHARPTPPAAAFERVLFDLHFAQFGGLLLKLLYALLALGVCAVVVTGNVIWLERRDPKRAHAGHRVLEKLTVGVCAGLVVATAVYFGANRVLPAALDHRADIELAAFLAAWALAALCALVLRASSRRILCVFMSVAGALFVLVVGWDLAFVEANLATALGRGLPAVFVGDALCLVLAAAAAGAAWSLRPVTLLAQTTVSERFTEVAATADSTGVVEPEQRAHG